MDFELPADLADYLDELDDFIEREIKPLEQENDNIRFFDHRREDARTDWERGGLPNEEWEDAAPRGAPAGRRRRPLPLSRSRRSTAARTAPTSAWPSSASTSPARDSGCTTISRTSTRSSATTSGLLLMIHYGTDEQKAEWVDDLAEGTARLRVRHHRTAARLGRDAHGDDRRARRRRLDHQRREDVEHRHPRRAVRPDLRPHERQGRRRRRHHRVPRPDEQSGLRDRRVPLDVQHADRPRAHPPHRRARAAQRHLRRRGPRPAGDAALLQREPHPPGGVEPRRGRVLHRPGGRVREGAGAVRQAARAPTRRSSSRSSSCTRSARCCGR